MPRPQDYKKHIIESLEQAATTIANVRISAQLTALAEFVRAMPDGNDNPALDYVKGLSLYIQHQIIEVLQGRLNPNVLSAELQETIPTVQNTIHLQTICNQQQLDRLTQAQRALYEAALRANEQFRDLLATTPQLLSIQALKNINRQVGEGLQNFFNVQNLPNLNQNITHQNNLFSDLFSELTRFMGEVSQPGVNVENISKAFSGKMFEMILTLIGSIFKPLIGENADQKVKTFAENGRRMADMMWLPSGGPQQQNQNNNNGPAVVPPDLDNLDDNDDVAARLT